MLKKSQGTHPNSFTDWPFDVWLNLKEMYGISKSDLVMKKIKKSRILEKNIFTTLDI